MADFGSVITPPGQYTHCVDRKNYQDVPGLLDAGFPTILEFLLCEYLLGGKLVCLAGGGDECAIGTVVGVEAVGAGKSGFDAIDNDFSFNVLLAPFRPDDFATYGKPPPPRNIWDPHKIRDDITAPANHPPFGWLLVDPPNPTPLPAPVDQTGAPGPPLGSPQERGSATWPLDGYGVLWKLDGGKLGDAGKEGDNLHKLWDQPPKTSGWPAPPGPTDGDFIPLPVLHCECEGSRIFFVCKALGPFLELMQGKVPGTGFSPGGACRAVAKRLPWPINKIVNAVCSLVEDIIAAPIALALAPAMAAALAAAWESAQAFDDLFVTGPVAKQIHVGDVVIVTGRWTWDAGHSGHTELHPVKTIQKLMASPFVLPDEVRPPKDLSTAPPADVSYIPSKPIPTSVSTGIRAVHDRWCRLAREAPPPPDPRHRGGLSVPQLGSLTPDQLAIYTSQQRPENGWAIHPLIDGCDPQEPAPPPVIVR